VQLQIEDNRSAYTELMVRSTGFVAGVDSAGRPGALLLASHRCSSPNCNMHRLTQLSIDEIVNELKSIRI